MRCSPLTQSKRSVYVPVCHQLGLYHLTLLYATILLTYYQQCVIIMKTRAYCLYENVMLIGLGL